MIPDHDVFSMTPVLDKEQKLIEFPSKHSSRRPLQYYVIPYQNCHRLPERDLCTRYMYWSIQVINETERNNIKVIFLNNIIMPAIRLSKLILELFND